MLYIVGVDDFEMGKTGHPSFFPPQSSCIGSGIKLRDKARKTHGFDQDGNAQSPKSISFITSGSTEPGRNHFP